MSDLPGHARVVIIGGGAVGVSALYHMAKAGWTDCVLLEKNELTAGSTWHAAGNCPSFSTSWAVMNMQRYSLELYRGLAQAVDYPMNYHVTGSIRLAHSRQRIQEFSRAMGMGRAQGMDLALLTPSEAHDLYPFLETHDLTGALWDPDDGDIDPAQLTQALAKGARALGARIHRFTPATGVSRANGEWVVHTEKGDIRCDKVVNAAGYHAQKVAEWFRPYGGRRLPMAVMSHQYLLTENIPELVARDAKLPLLRDVDSSYYLRQEKHGFNLGPYERNCRAHWADPADPMPDDFSFQLFPDDLDRLEWYITDACARVPLLGTVGVSRVINGPIPYAPDGLPLIGPMPGVPDAFEACVFTFGIVQAGGAGKVLAEWVTQGATEWDMWACDPRRFTAHADDSYARVKSVETYGHEYAMHFPHAHWPAGRDQRRASIHDRLIAAGAVMAPYNGWERAEWFAKPGDDLTWDATQTWDRAGPWETRIAAECAAVQNGCGVLAISGFTRLAVSGPGARAHVDGLTCSRLPPPGRVGLAYFCDHRGRVVTEMSVMDEGPDRVGLITASVAQWHDAEWLWRGAPQGITVTDHSDQAECLLMTGPQARAVLAGLTDADLTKPWLSIQTTRVAGCDVALLRVSFAGELGWEVHCATADAPAIWDAVTTAGALPFGMKALDRMRLEKGYRGWKSELSTDYTALELGLRRFIDWTKPFPGRETLLAQQAAGVSKRLVTLVLDEAADADAPYMSNVWVGDRRVGETLSGGYGYRIGASLSLAMVATDAGDRVEVEVFGQRRTAQVVDGAVWDAANARMRG